MFTARAPRLSYSSFYDPREPAGTIVITERDVEIFRYLAKRRFVSTRELQAIFGSLVDRRLRALFRHRYIDRPDAQRLYRQYREGGGSNAGIHALANRGADVLRKLKLIPDNGRDWSEQNRTLSPTTLLLTQPHEDAVADTRLLFRRVVAENANLSIRFTDEFLRGAAAQTLQIPGGMSSIRHDLAFVTFESDATRDGFAVEVDCCSEPHTRYSSKELESLAGKFERYLLYARAKRYEEQFGVRSFRILTITTGSDARVEEIAKAANEVCGGVGVNRFLATNFSA